MHGWKHQCLAIAHVLYTHRHTHEHARTHTHTHIHTSFHKSHTHLQLLSITVLRLYSCTHWLVLSLVLCVHRQHLWQRSFMLERLFSCNTKLITSSSIMEVQKGRKMEEESLLLVFFLQPRSECCSFGHHPYRF